jgi:hydrogenase maturation protease
VIIVDTVKGDLPPGTLRVFDEAGVLRRRPSVRVGPHDPGVKEALLMLEFAGRAPRELALIGLSPDGPRWRCNCRPRCSRRCRSPSRRYAALLGAIWRGRAEAPGAAGRRARSWWSTAVA